MLVLCSKSRVAPVKSLTVPKLELCAANLLAELVDVAIKVIRKHCEAFCSSDSTVVLSWLCQHPSNFNIFVANRLARIQSLTTDLPERRRIILAATTLCDFAIECKFHNSFFKMQRVFAYVYKFLYSTGNKRSEYLSPEDIKNGTKIIVKNIQMIIFESERKA